MTLEEIFSHCKELSVFEERCLTDDYYEVVFYVSELDKISNVFTGMFGEAVKPAGVKPTKEHLAAAQAYGGVWNDQTLYKKEFDDTNTTVIAMFWPWQDSTHLTLKMARL